MASELRVNTLKDAAGNNSIAMSFVAGGCTTFAVKGAADATPANSLNVSGGTDNGTGDYTYAMVSAFDAEGEEFPAGCTSMGITGFARIKTGTTTASAITIVTLNSSASAADIQHGCLIAGDLA